MSTLSTKMDLVLPVGGDQFKTSDYVANWGKVDAAPGCHVCTSATRPTWAAGKNGRLIYETDTGLEWLWSGSAFVRTTPTGLLSTTSGAKAYVLDSRNINWTGTSLQMVVAVTGVVVPPGLRPLQVRVRWGTANRAAAGSVLGAISRSATAGTGPFLDTWTLCSYDAVEAYPTYKGGGCYFSTIPSGLAAGTYDFSFQVACDTATGANGFSAVTTANSLYVVEL